MLEAVRARDSDDHPFIEAIEKHRADERNQYVMFRRWYEKQGRMPLFVDRLPILFLNFRLRRRSEWADAHAKTGLHAAE